MVISSKKPPVAMTLDDAIIPKSLTDPMLNVCPLLIAKKLLKFKLCRFRSSSVLARTKFPDKQVVKRRFCANRQNAFVFSLTHRKQTYANKNRQENTAVSLTLTRSSGHILKAAKA